MIPCCQLRLSFVCDGEGQTNAGLVERGGTGSWSGVDGSKAGGE